MSRWINQQLANLLLKDVTYSNEHAQTLQELATRGELVFALPFSSKLLALGFRHTARAKNLAQNPRLVFLKRTSTLLTWGKKRPADPLAALLRQQQESQKPIFIIPHLLVLGRRRARADKSAMDLVFGSRDAPGYLRLFLRLILTQGQAHWQVGEPILIQPETSAHELRFSLRRQFHRLESAHIGPKAKSYTRLKRETLKDPTLTAYINNAAQETGVALPYIKKKCDAYFREIAANFDGEFVRLLDVVLRFLFHRIYDGLSYDAAEVNQLRKASLKGPLILLPTHKSHMDYLVMSYVLYQEGLMPPHVAAGANLSFFPLGSIFRRGGAFFIRRQFRGDPLYPKVVRAYLKRLLKEGFTQEFFIEGGRSRTGKTLTPKLGLLSIYIDCLCSERFQDAVFVPTSIAYERIVEAQSYDEEQAGKPKATENAKGLLSSTQVLTKRFGRVFVSFDKPVILSEFMAARNFDYARASPDDRQRFIKSLAHQTILGMNQSVVVTPAAIIALVLLSSKTRALREDRFLSQTLDVLGLLQAIYPEIRLSDALTNDTEASIESALALLAQDGQIVKKESKNLSYVLAPAKKARSLNFYKNTILHFFVNDALIACAYLAEKAHLADRQPATEAVKLRVQQLSQIFKFEFVFGAVLPFDQIFASRVEFLKERGIFAEIESELVLSNSSQAQADLEFLSRMLRPFFESYFIVFYDAQSRDLQKLSEKDFLAHTLKHLSEGLESGLITRPEAVNKQVCESAVLALKSYAAPGDTWPDRNGIAELFRAVADVVDALE